ncbi:MAG: hypothetical protein WC824_12730 [Bacteroidota bacterium]|jgi:hypothetical protein
MGAMDEFETLMERRFLFLARLLSKTGDDPDCKRGDFTERESEILAILGFCEPDINKRIHLDRSLAIEKHPDGSFSLLNTYDHPPDDKEGGAQDFPSLLLFLADNKICP